MIIKGILSELIALDQSIDDLSDFSRKIGINITTIRAFNNGGPASIKTISKIGGSPRVFRKKKTC